MPRSLTLLLLVFLVGSCSSGPPAEEPSYDPNMLGRWDGTIQAGESYPLWFELSSRGAEGQRSEGDEGNSLKGRLQPRFGHALELEEVEATGTHVTMRVAETSYEGDFDGAGFQGTGEEKDGGRFEWVARRAPNLPARPEPKWAPPVALFDGKDLTGWTAAKRVRAERVEGRGRDSCESGHGLQSRHR